MNTAYDGRSANEFYHGDEHLCWSNCQGDKYNNCTCELERQETYHRMAEEFQIWLVNEGQA